MNEKYSATVLYVEDEAMVREPFVEMLNRRVKKVITATNGQEGLELYHQQKPDLVITDIKMPVMTGLEAAFDIKKHCPYLPVIAQTAYAQVHDRQEAYSAGCDDYIEKPFTPMRLIDIIQKHIN